MSKTLNALEQLKEIRRNKLTGALEKNRSEAQAQTKAPAEVSVKLSVMTPKEFSHEFPKDIPEPNEASPVIGKHSFIGVPVLVAVVIIFGIVFAAINYQVFAQLHSVRNSIELLMQKTGVQNGKVSTIENSIAQVNAENKKLRNDFERQEKAVTKLVEKVQSDVSENTIATGILRTKLSELNSAQRKISDDVQKIKKAQPATAQ